MDRDRDLDGTIVDDVDVDPHESHATTGGAAAAGAVTGGVIGLTGGPLGAAIGAVGGALVGAAAERMMHSDDDAERARAGLGNDHDGNPMVEDRSKPTIASPDKPFTRSEMIERDAP
jgi:outer membrane lipoprotein SlyB